MDEYISTRRKGPSTKPVLIAVLASFLLGGAVAGYAVYSMGGDRDPAPAATEEEPVAQVAPAAAEPSPTPSATASEAEAQQAVERVAEQQGGIDQRLAAAEQRLARLDLQAEAAASNASRAESLLIAFASRRALERGEDLGYLRDQLRLRFADARPNAVNAVLEGAERKQTADRLIARLDTLADELQDPQEEATLDRIGREIGSLFIFRNESTASPQPQRRVERARFFLQSGRIDRAVGEVEQLPGANTEAGQRWLSDAKSLARAFEALDLLEGAAILDSGTVRDGSGRSIADPSPVQATN